MSPTKTKSRAVRSSNVTQASLDTLVHVSRDLRNQGCYLQSAKCLEAVCSSNVQALPADKAIACLDYAELLLDHFDNLDLAKAMLFKAERELRSTRTHHTLQCQVYHNLLRCHRASNNIHQAIEAAKLGLAVCTSQQATKQKNIASWRTYFYFRLAECTLESSGPSAALAVLDNIDASAISPIEQALLALSRAVAHFHAAAFDAADHQLTACATAIEAALVEDELRQQHNGKDSDEIMIQSMRAQYFLLYAIVAQAVGRTGQLQQGNEFPLFANLQEAITSAGSQPNAASWFPAPATATLGHMLHAAVLRAAGRGSAAAMQLGQAEEVLENILSSAGVTWSAAERDIPPMVKHSMHIYIHLRALAGEHRAVASLLATDFTSTAQHILHLLGAIQRYPSMLSSRIPSIAMLVGHYAHSTKEYDAAVKLFKGMLSSPLALAGTTTADTPHSGAHGVSVEMRDGKGDGLRHRAVAAVCCALSQLHQGQGQDVLDSARRTLESNHLDSAALNTATDMPTHEKASAQLVNGLLLYMQKDIPGSRLLLTKALKQAHGLIGSTQLVGQVLNVLAPVQQDRQDYAGAAQMYESSMTLLKSIGDLPSLVTTLHGLHDLHTLQGKEELAVKSEQYLQRKADDLSGRLNELIKSREHAQVLQSADWLLAHMS